MIQHHDTCRLPKYFSNCWKHRRQYGPAHDRDARRRDRLHHYPAAYLSRTAVLSWKPRCDSHTRWVFLQRLKENLTFSALWMGAQHPSGNGAGEHRFRAAKAQGIRRNSHDWSRACPAAHHRIIWPESDHFSADQCNLIFYQIYIFFFQKIYKRS